MSNIFETIGTVNIAKNSSNADEARDEDIDRRNTDFERRRHKERDQLDDFGCLKVNDTDFGSDMNCPNSSNIGTLNAASFDNNHTKSVVISNIGKGISTN